MAELEESLAKVKGRWMIGGPALDQAPTGWRDVAADDTDPEIALLALACQAGQIAFRPRPPHDLTVDRALPKLTLPTLPDPLRPSFRRLRHVLKPDSAEMATILHLMAARGVTVHPADFMPSSVDALPDCYAPWGDWQDRPEGSASELTVDSWEFWGTAERRLELEKIRATDPAAARALLEAKLGEMPAEHRLRLIAVLQVGLSEADAPYLESLGTDRSQKVRALSAQFLARLGRIADETALADELAGFLTISTGLLRAGKVSSGPIKTSAQKTRRQELFETVSLAGLARAMSLTPDDLIARWASKSSDLRATAGFAAMVAATGSDAQAEACLDRLLAEAHGILCDLRPLLLRLPAEARAARLSQILSQDNADLRVARAIMAQQPGGAPFAILRDSGAVERLTKAVVASAKDEGTRRTDAMLQDGLTALGLLADADAAERLVTHFTQLGLISADPALAMLTFNAALGEISWPNS